MYVANNKQLLSSPPQTNFNTTTNTTTANSSSTSTMNNSQEPPTTPVQFTTTTATNNASSSSYNASSVLTLQNLTPAQIPSSMLHHTVKPARCDIYSRKSADELKFYRDYYFIKFVEHLNKLNRADEKRTYSKSTLNYCEANLANNTSAATNSDYCLATYAINSNIQTTATTLTNSSLGNPHVASTSSNYLSASSSASTPNQAWVMQQKKQI